MKQKQLVVIGGGAAGFFCAVNAARLNPQLRVDLLEKSGKLLSKVRISGGGRCNVTHACFDIREMIRNYPRGGNFLKKAFHLFFTPDTVDWFHSRGVSLKTEADGRMFPKSNSSQAIVDCLMREADKCGIGIHLNSGVKSLAYQNNQWMIHGEGAVRTTDYVCVACGGYSQTGAYQWLRETGHSIEEPVPSLFTFNMPGNPIRKLMGISVEDAGVRIRHSGFYERGPILITHWGMSGPVILRLSAWAARHLHTSAYKFSIGVNWLPKTNEEELRRQFREWRYSFALQKISASSPAGLPLRLWQYLLDQSGVPAETRWSDLPSRTQNRLISNLLNQELAIEGKTSFKEEFVTAGGIRLQEVNPQTMESKKIPGLYFAGEVLDADGITGGFNFQQAWTTGFIAARSVSQKSLL